MDEINAPDTSESTERADQRADAWMIKSQIIGKAQEGRWNPETAEKVARRLKVDPLSREPDPSQFDPMTKATWSLSMTAAWLCWRTPERVRGCWNDYRRECWDWHWYRSRLPVDGGKTWRDISGWELRQREPITLTTFSLMEALDEVGEFHWMIMSVKAAREQLWESLAQNNLVATAIKQSTGQPIQIPAHEWPYLTLISDSNLTDEIGFQSPVHKVEYHDLTFARTDVEKLWRAFAQQTEPTLDSTKTTRKNAPERVVREAVASLVKENSNASTREADDLAKQLGANRDLVRTELNAAREKAGNPVKLGRPRKK